MSRLIPTENIPNALALIRELLQMGDDTLGQDLKASLEASRNALLDRWEAEGGIVNDEATQ